MKQQAGDSSPLLIGMVMRQFQKLLFAICVLALSWLGMMAVHEFGHVVGAVVTRGNVERVVLHPLAISRTDVLPNPYPGVVVWFGPILGCIIPVVVWLAIPRRFRIARGLAMFFAGFCLLANGAYIAIGSFDRVGDCGVMLQSGSPLWTLFAFGIATIPTGFFIWHQMGSLKEFFESPSLGNARLSYLSLAALACVVIVELVLSGK